MTRVTVVAHAAKIDDNGRRGLCEALNEAVRSEGWPEPVWFFTTEQEPGRGLAEQAVKDGAQLVVACGGDGTVNSCAAGLAGSGVPLAVLGLGTGNLIAGNLGIPTSLPDVLEVLISGVDRPIDVGRTAEGLVIGMAGLGLDAAMTADAPAWLKKHAGWPAYVVSLLRHLPDAGIHVSVELDGNRHFHDRIRTLVIGNMGTLRGGISLLPDAAPDDGLLDVVLLAPRGPFGWLRIAGRLATRRRGSTNAVQRFQGRHIVVRTRHTVQREADGELLSPGRVLDVRIDPGALLVRVPRGE